MFHLGDQLFEGRHFLGSVTMMSMAKELQHLHFTTLGSTIIKLGPQDRVKERGNNGINTNGLARTSDNIRHLGQIQDHRLTCHILPQYDRNLGSKIVPRLIQ